MASCVRKSELMIELIKLAAERIRRFTHETGQPLDWVHSGSLKVAAAASPMAVSTFLRVGLTRRDAPRYRDPVFAAT